MLAVDQRSGTLEPFEYIDEVFGGHSKTMYGNLYKCGDETDAPHWATWSKVERLDFHAPEFFGRLIID